MQLGNLADVRRLSCGMFPRRLAKSISQGIARGLNHLHDHDIIHRDLKPQNVLMGTDDGGVLIPRIADFGWARSVRDVAGGASQPPSGHRGLTPGAVTPIWRPLEIELGLQYSFPADLWSFGLIVMELLTGDDWVSGNRNVPAKCILKVITDLAGPVDSTCWPDAAICRRYQAFMAEERTRPAEERFPLASHPFSNPARELEEGEAELTKGLLKLVPATRLSARAAALHRGLTVARAAGGSIGCNVVPGSSLETSGVASRPAVVSEPAVAADGIHGICCLGGCRNPWPRVGAAATMAPRP